MFKHLLVPLDGSKLAEEALQAACEVASKFNSEITLLRVATQSFIPAHVDGPYYADFLMTLRQQAGEEAVDYLKALKGSLRQQGFKAHAQVIQDEMPAEAILAVSKGQPIDAIVMSTHGHSGIARWVFGSVAEKVLRHSNIPVVLVRSKESLLDIELPAIENEEDIRTHELS